MTEHPATSQPWAIQRIVVPTDGLDDRHPATLVAIDIATRLGVPVELFSAADETAVVERFDLVQHEALTLDQLVGVDVVTSSDAATTISRLRREADTLVCLASSGQMALAEAAKASVSAHVLTEAGHPVLVVGPACRPLLAGRQLAIAIDGTPDGERIVAPAIELADALRLLPTLYQVLPPVDLQVIHDIPDSAYVASVARRHTSRLGDIGYDVLHDRHPGAALERLATDPDVAILALATRGTRPIERLVTPSITHRLIRHATCPVLVGQRHGTTASDPLVIPPGPRVVVGVEGRTTDAPAVALAVDEADSRGATLHIVHVWQPAWSFADTGAAYADADTPRNAARQMLDQLTAEITDRSPTVPVVTWLTDGLISIALATAAHDADVLIVGERQYHAIEEFLFGHIADAVLSRTTTPVILVPED